MTTRYRAHIEPGHGWLVYDHVTTDCRGGVVARIQGLDAEWIASALAGHLNASLPPYAIREDEQERKLREVG